MIGQLDKIGVTFAFHITFQNFTHLERGTKQTKCTKRQHIQTTARTDRAPLTQCDLFHGAAHVTSSGEGAQLASPATNNTLP